MAKPSDSQSTREISPYGAKPSNGAGGKTLMYHRPGKGSTIMNYDLRGSQIRNQALPLTEILQNLKESSFVDDSKSERNASSP